MVPDIATFTETLLFAIKNDVCSFQHFVSVKKTEQRKSVENDLKLGKLAPDPNNTKIRELEKILLNINEHDLQAEVNKSPLFEFINNEKITPEF